MCIVQLLSLSGRRWKFSMDVTVVVELASKIQDLVQNESGELLAHSIDLIGRITFIPIWDIYRLEKKTDILTLCTLV